MSTSEKAQNISLLNSSLGTDTNWNINVYQFVFKRAFDLALCFLLLPVTLPLLFLLMLLVKIDSRGPAIFKSERIGKGGKKFKCYKLRTMCLDANKKLEKILASDVFLRNEWQMDHKLKNDPRVTRVGKCIRSLSLDELPQIFNVIKGEMSFVGPRPIVEEEIRKYGANFASYKKVMPGITGPWQTNGRNDISYDERVEMDRRYANNNSFLVDLKILVKTIPAALSKRGAY